MWDFWWALKAVLTQVMKSPAQDLVYMMPEDLFRPAWSALDLKSKDYDKALRMKSRLGKYLKDPRYVGNAGHKIPWWWS
jgi:hypothetical protein